MSTASFSLPGPTLGELVHLATSYFMFLELHMDWGQDSEIGWVGRPQGLQLLLKVSFKHLWTLPWTPVFYHCLKQKQWRQARLIWGLSVTGSHCVSGGLAGSSTEDSSSVGWGLRTSDPSILSESGEAQTQGTPFFLYEEIRSGNIIGKNNLQKLDSL